MALRHAVRRFRLAPLIPSRKWSRTTLLNRFNAGTMTAVRSDDCRSLRCSCTRKKGDRKLRLHHKRRRSRNPRTACQSVIQLRCLRPVSARDGPTGGEEDDEAAGAVAEAGVEAAGAGAVGAGAAGGAPKPLDSACPVSSSRLVAP